MYTERRVCDTCWIRTSVEMFSIHIQALLNSADEWEMSIIMWTGIAAHDPSISSRNYSSVTGFVRYTASFKYLHKRKSSGINSAERGGTHPFSYYPSVWQNLINVAPVTWLIMWETPLCWKWNITFSYSWYMAGAVDVRRILRCGRPMTVPSKKKELFVE